MKREHKVFTHEYMKHHDPLKAYAKAYPGTDPKNHHSSAAKLLRRADIKAYIKEAEEPAHEKALAELQEMAKERIKLEMLDTEQKRHTCALIVLGKWKVKRSVKLHGELVDVYNDPSPAAVLRAIELDTKLEQGWFIREKKQPAEQKEEHKPIAISGFVLNGKIREDEDGHYAMQLKWEKDNPDKVQHKLRKGSTERFQLGETTYLVTPPWQLDPEWYNKQQRPSPVIADWDDPEKAYVTPAVLQSTNLQEDLGDQLQGTSPLKGPACRTGRDLGIHLQRSSPLRGDLGGSHSVSICVQNPIQPTQNQSFESAEIKTPHATFDPKTDTTSKSNKKKSYWEMTAQERWAVYWPLNTNQHHYLPEQIKILEMAYYNMSAKAQINRIISLRESNNHRHAARKTG